ncbi:MAG: signal peptidase I [Gammaproteobacteria bacterium]|nr:signal peptidase I [Gammaproteobacteria bacterium]
MVLFRSVIADWNQVPTGSMEPNIMVGDRIVVDKVSYDLRVPFTLNRIFSWGDPRRGDIVIFPNPNDDDMYVKRLVAIPGDTIEMRNNRLSINGSRASYRPLTDDAAEHIASQITTRSVETHRFFEETVLDSKRVIMESRYNRNPTKQSFGPITLPEGTYFVLGDNRDNSKDSRQFGLLERERVLGRAYAIAFSIDMDGPLKLRLNRFFTDLE